MTDRASRSPVHAVVVGQAGRDLVVQAQQLPAAGATATVTTRVERLGGKGANQAVGLRQLLSADDGARISLISVVGEDAAGAQVLSDAKATGIDVEGVMSRGRTALFIDVVAPPGDRRVLEDVPAEALLTADDIRQAGRVFEDADAVVLQLQQPVDALLVAADLGLRSGALIVLDGASDEARRDDLFAAADIIRCDAQEAELVVGRRLHGRDAVTRAAAELLVGRTKVVAFGVADEGDVVVWAHGEHFLPRGPLPPVDPTGGGDAFVAGLTVALLRGEKPERAGRLAAAAAAGTVGRLGGRPDLAHLVRARP